MGGRIYSFNLNISPKMSYGVLECDFVMLQNYLAGVAQWTEHWPANKRVAGLIPSQGTCLGCRITCLWLCNKRFCNTKGEFFCQTLYNAILFLWNCLAIGEPLITCDIGRNDCSVFQIHWQKLKANTCSMALPSRNILPEFLTISKSDSNIFTASHI